MTEIKNEELEREPELKQEPETAADSEITQDSEITVYSGITHNPESTKDPEIAHGSEETNNSEIVQNSESANEPEIEQNSENAKDSEIVQKSDTEKQNVSPEQSETPLLTKKQKKHAAIQAPPEGEYGEGAYNYKTIYTSKIEPHVKEILLLCDQYHIPAFMTFAISNNKEETKYASEVLSEVVEGRELTKDVISKHVLVMSGFDVVPEYEEMIVEELL